MFKVTPNPPQTDPSANGLDPKKVQEATDRALDFYLNPKDTDAGTDTPPGQLFTVIDGIDTESLLANLSESLASANAMINDLAFDLEGSRRHVALGIQQVIELSELLANRALDNVDPR
ncbi:MULTISPECIES: DUF6124 family protein [unclassified Pseudomonas]|uniref:DUF6124 family protein n=1 Tax=unclassified Pseudomonas TaxID=196821 RepID=UPI000538A9BF|nr:MULTISPECIES: DUF6124 family protein [unclassified Pseudomonas]MBD0682954.1 hypothetical protein [Pseudomonas sp. PSB18]CDF93939.1 hypothetical protein BN844_2091 [Pseudomonas sp. SHC52]